MAPSTTQQILLSPAELSYLHTSLSLTPPIRPDGRTSTQFRPLVAECDILPGTNGSARICFSDGTEAVVGVKAEVEKSQSHQQAFAAAGPDEEDEGAGSKEHNRTVVSNEWMELSVEIPGFRDDDSLPVFLAAMLSEALLADRDFTGKLWINKRFHWKIYIDILLLSQPLSYPLPLLSLTTHLALLSARLPKLKSEADEDPLFDDDWDVSEYIYSRSSHAARSRPPITLLVMAVKDNILFDPSKEELAVAEVALAISVGERLAAGIEQGNVDVATGKVARDLRMLSVRTIDPPSRLTHAGVPNALNTATGGVAATSTAEQATAHRETSKDEGVWQPPRGGAKRTLIAAMIRKVLEQGGVAEEVLDGLDAVDLG